MSRSAAAATERQRRRPPRRNSDGESTAAAAHPTMIAMRNWARMMVVAGAVCTICDHWHATSGVLSYSSPSIWSQAWWAPLLFAFASLALVGPLRPLHARFGLAHPVRPSL